MWHHYCPGWVTFKFSSKFKAYTNKTKWNALSYSCVRAVLDINVLKKNVYFLLLYVYIA